MLPTFRNGGSAVDTLVDVSRHMDRLVNSIWTDQNGNGQTAWLMPVEVIETGDEVRFDVELPGVRLEDIDITLENNILTIAAHKKAERPEGLSDSDYRLVERRYGTFQRSFTVPRTVRSEDCQAHYENGILTLRLPKTEEAKPRRIRVEAAPASRQINEKV